MNHFLSGFANELVKVGAFGPQTAPPDAYDPDAVKGALKPPKSSAEAGPKATPPARRTVAAPSPLTTPAHMIDVASKI